MDLKHKIIQWNCRGLVAVYFDTAMASLSSVMLNRLLYSSVFEEVKLSLIFSSCFLMF